MRLKAILTVAALLALAPLTPGRGQTGYPMIISVHPVGCKRGATTEVQVTGRFNLQGAYAVVTDDPGLTGEVIPAPEADRAKATDTIRLKLSAGATSRLGPAELRVVTLRGVSTVGQVVLGDEAPVTETEPNNTPAQAATVTLPAMLNGVIQAGEDVDVYRFTAQAGETLVFECMSARLQDKIHDLTPGGGGTHSDPILLLTDASGRELATADDTFGADPILSYKTEKAGDYVLQVRDVRYSGAPGWTYTVRATQRPFLLGVYPMAGTRGKPAELLPVGFSLDGMPRLQVSIPAEAPVVMPVQAMSGGTGTNAVPFLTSTLAQVLETEGNDAFAGGTPATIPAGLNGRIEKENDVDCFRFKGLKGKTLSITVAARRYGSALDSTVDIIDATGRVHASNDDSLGKDSRLDWTCPDESEYAVRITDLHSRGGAGYLYNVEVALARPDFSLQCDDDKALVGAGGGYAMFVMATRKNGFAGDIKLAVENLPPGVTATADRIPASMSAPLAACVILRAAPDAKPDFRRIRIVGTGEVAAPDGSKEVLRRVVEPLQEIYFPGGGRGRFPVETHMVSVTEPADVLLKLSSTRIDLKPGGTAVVEVEVVRQKGYNKNVVLDIPLRHLSSVYANPLPPGVTLDESASKTLLGPTDTKGRIVLKAAANAGEIKDLPIAVLGQISINFVVKVSHASEPLLLSVSK